MARKTRYKGKSLVDQHWRAQPLRSFRFQDCILKGCSFKNCNLTDATFEGATLIDCNFWYCNLTKVNFREATLSVGIIESAARYTNLEHSGIIKLELIRSNIERIEFPQYVDPTKVSLRDCVNVPPLFENLNVKTLTDNGTIY